MKLFKNLVHYWSQRAPKKARKPLRQTAGRLFVECLEERVNPAAAFADAVAFNSIPQAVFTDASRNVYFAGETFNSQTRNTSVTMTRRDEGGNTFDLGTLAGSGTISVRDIVADASGSIYITGSFQGEIDFDPSQINVTANSSYQTVFVSKFSREGTHQWSQRVISSSNFWGEGEGLSLDSLGNLYVAGWFEGTGRFDSQNRIEYGIIATPSPFFSSDGFLWKLNASSGATTWVHRIGGSERDRAYGVAVTPQNQIFVTGDFQGLADFNSSSSAAHTIRSNGLTDVYLAQYNPDGTYVNAWSWGGLDWDYARGITAGPEGAVYVTGSHIQGSSFRTASTSNSEGQNTPASNFGGRDAFVWRHLNNSDWIRSVGGTGEDSGRAVSVDPFGNIYVTGEVTGVGAFGSLTVAGQGRNSDVFVARMRSDGSFQNVYGLGGNFNDFSRDIAVDSAGNIYTVGNLQGGEGDFDPGTEQPWLHSDSDNAGFLSQLTESGQLFYAVPSGNGADNLTVRMNGSLVEIFDNNTTRVVARRTVRSTTDIRINGAMNEDDTLTIDLNGPAGFSLPQVVFDGGLGGGNRLVLQGSIPFTSETYVTNSPNSGEITFNSTNTGSRRVTFANVQSVDDSIPLITPPSNPGRSGLTFNASDIAPDPMILGAGVSVNGFAGSQLSSSFGTFALTRLANKSSLLINGLGEDDSLTVNFSAGNPIPTGGLTFDGGVGSNNRLSLLNNGFTNTTVSSSSMAAGTIGLQDARLGSTPGSVVTGPLYNIALFNIANIDDTGRSVAANGSVSTMLPPSLVFNASQAGDVISVVDGPTVNGVATTRIQSNFTFVSLNFANRSSATINAQGGNDTITLNHPRFSPRLNRLFINGGVGNDSLTVDFRGGNSIPAGGLTFDGDAGNNPLTLLEAGFTSTTYSTRGPNAGDIAYQSRTQGTPTNPFPWGTVFNLNYGNVSIIQDVGRPITTTTGILMPSLVFNASLGADDIRILNGTADNTTRLVSNGTFAPVTFANRNALTINSLDGDDIISVDHATRSTGLTRLTLDAGAGEDIVSLTRLDSAVTMTALGGANGSVNRVNGDTLNFANYTSGVSVNLSNNTATGFIGGISGFENAVGSRFNDTLVGSVGNNILRGGAGSDRLTGLDGDDILLGESDNDPLLDGGSGRDLVIGGAGADSLLGGTGEDILIAGTLRYEADVLALMAVAREWNSTARGYGDRVRNLRLGGGANVLNGLNVLVSGQVVPDAGTDALFGNTEDDWYLADIPPAGTDTYADWDRTREWLNDTGPTSASYTFSVQSASIPNVTLTNGISSIVIDGVTNLTAASQITLRPGSHTVSIDSGPSVTFTVTNNGMLYYETSLEGILLGTGTSNLTVRGTPLRVNAQALANPQLWVDGRALPGLRGNMTFAVMPGWHTLSLENGTWLRFQLFSNGTLTDLSGTALATLSGNSLELR